MAKESRQKHRFRRGRQVTASAIQEVAEFIEDLPLRRDLLIEYLHRIQDHYHYLSAAHLAALAHILKLSQVEVYEVASFYHHFDIVKEGDSAPAELTIRVCDSISCEMKGANELVATLQNSGIKHARIQRVPCVGRCAQAPVAVVGTCPVAEATPEKISQTVDQGLDTEIYPDVLTYEEYRDLGGYSFYAQLKQTFNVDKKEQIIKTLEDSGLRGAGFPTGRKWRIVSQQPAPRYMAVNIDEGEPGTFKDRYYLEKDPRKFIEGMLIAALALEVELIVVYIRDEYPAIRQMLIAEFNSFRDDPDCVVPEIQLRRGAGSYVCGEESAMLESIEGKRGMPRLRPPYVAERGLFGKPTLVHNMETLYWVRDIIVKGAHWFASQGRHGRHGLRSFSVSGRVNKPGVYQAPAGITLNELVNEYCDGMQVGHTLYGYLPGGASGGILPASLADIPLDFDTLQDYGCFIGSAAIIVFSQADSARQIALNAMRFFRHESCGQCTPCRIGCEKAVALMEQDQWDMSLMQDLSNVMRDASICGLGQAAPNPMDCVMRYFPQELES